MITKTALLQTLNTLENQLNQLRQTIEQLPDMIEPNPVDLGDELFIESNIEIEENDENDDNDLEEVFKFLREAWDIPPNITPSIPIEEMQKRMSEGLPKNWASREIMRMREE